MYNLVDTCYNMVEGVRMEKEFKDVIDKVNELEGEELGKYISFLESENNECLKNKEVLLTMAEKLGVYGYPRLIVKDRLNDMGLNMQNEIDRINKEKTIEFMEGNLELLETLDIVTRWWIEAIKKPFFRYFDLKEAKVDEAIFMDFPINRKKIEDKNKKAFTEKKAKKFTETLAFEIADSIRKEGQCELWVHDYACWLINKSIDAADLRAKIFLPKKVDMIITTNQIKMLDDRGHWKIVYDGSIEKKEEKEKTM